MLALDSRAPEGPRILLAPSPVDAPDGRRGVFGILLRALNSARPGRGD